MRRELAALGRDADRYAYALDLAMEMEKRFAGSDADSMKKKAADFFSSGSGGPQVYDGKDMLSAHKHMNISDNEYMAAVDDLMAALSNSGVGDAEKAEVLYIFYTLRPEVVGV